MNRTVAKKVLHLIRHGQAVHNVRAEPRRAAGGSHEELIAIMKEDDCFDAPLTDFGLQQASTAGAVARYRGGCEHVELVVASPLSRALHTADLIFPPASLPQNCTRVCMEHFRERKGILENAQRRRASELSRAFPHWDFRSLIEEDEVLDDTLEVVSTCAQRAYEGLCLTLNRPEEHVAIVGHGGVFRHLLKNHPKVLADSEVRQSFANCEMRSCELRVETDCSGVSSEQEPVIHLIPLQT